MYKEHQNKKTKFVNFYAVKKAREEKKLRMQFSLDFLMESTIPKFIKMPELLKMVSPAIRIETHEFNHQNYFVFHPAVVY